MQAHSTPCRLKRRPPSVFWERALAALVLATCLARAVARHDSQRLTPAPEAGGIPAQAAPLAAASRALLQITPTNVPRPTGEYFQQQWSAATVREVWVSPTAGSDANDGASRTRALRTLRAAWGRVPREVPLTGVGDLRGVRILLTPGTMDASTCEWRGGRSEEGIGRHPLSGPSRPQAG